VKEGWHEFADRSACVLIRPGANRVGNGTCRPVTKTVTCHPHTPGHDNCVYPFLAHTLSRQLKGWLSYPAPCRCPRRARSLCNRARTYPPTKEIHKKSDWPHRNNRDYLVSANAGFSLSCLLSAIGSQRYQAFLIPVWSRRSKFHPSVSDCVSSIRPSISSAPLVQRPTRPCID
jgi:hypothetical protein